MLGDQLKRLRLARGLTQRQLAKMIGISPSTIGMYEQNRREPDNNTLVRLCRVFSVSSDFLLGSLTQNTEANPTLQPGASAAFDDFDDGRDRLLLKQHELRWGATSQDDKKTDVYDMIDRLGTLLMGQTELMLGGTLYPVDADDIEKMFEAMKLGAEIALAKEHQKKSK